MWNESENRCQYKCAIGSHKTRIGKSGTSLSASVHGATNARGGLLKWVFNSSRDFLRWVHSAYCICGYLGQCQRKSCGQVVVCITEFEPVCRVSSRCEVHPKNLCLPGTSYLFVTSFSGFCLPIIYWSLIFWKFSYTNTWL